MLIEKQQVVAGIFVVALAISLIAIDTDSTTVWFLNVQYLYTCLIGCPKYELWTSLDDLYNTKKRFLFIWQSNLVSGFWTFYLSENLNLDHPDFRRVQFSDVWFSDSYCTWYFFCPNVFSSFMYRIILKSLVLTRGHLWMFTKYKIINFRFTLLRFNIFIKLKQ